MINVSLQLLYHNRFPEEAMRAVTPSEHHLGLEMRKFRVGHGSVIKEKTAEVVCQDPDVRIRRFLASLPRSLLFRGFGFKHKTGTHARGAALVGMA
jgi:hypothetical protein